MKVRPLDMGLASCLREALYQAIYNPGEEPLDRAVLEEPDLAKYYEAWGRELDFGFVAVPGDVTGVVGTCWCRLFEPQDPGFGFVDEATPELSIAVWESYRGRGIGETLLQGTIEEARVLGCPGLSLSVHRQNRCVNLYLRNGFEIIGSGGDDYVMRLRLT